MKKRIHRTKSLDTKFDKAFNTWLYAPNGHFDIPQDQPETHKGGGKTVFNRWLYGQFDTFASNAFASNTFANTFAQKAPKNVYSQTGGLQNEQDSKWLYKGNKFIDMRNYFPILRALNV